MSTHFDGPVNIARLGHRNAAKANVAGDFALSAGWGSTASAVVTAGSTDTFGEITVTSAGTGQAANPTVTLTFANGTYPAAPLANVKANGGTGTQAHVQCTTTATTLVITWVGTPVAASTYKIVWDVRT